jgi:hypothetical protein
MCVEEDSIKKEMCWMDDMDSHYPILHKLLKVAICSFIISTVTVQKIKVGVV